MRIRQIVSGAAALFVLGGISASSAAGQLGNASVTTLGVAGNATATARGVGAISVNPAGLAMPGSGFTLALFPVAVRTGIDPITLKDLKDVEGQLVSDQTKADWLSRVTADGGQTGQVGVDVNLLALSMGKIGLQLSSTVGGELNLSPDIVQVLLYGNAGRQGKAENISIDGSSVTGWAVSTAAISAGIPLNSAAGSMAVGGTLKFSVGNALVVGQAQGGITADPLKVDLQFPIVLPPEEDAGFQNGSGIGLDVGFQAKKGKLSYGATVQNVFNTFKWTTDDMAFRPVTVLFDGNNNDSDTDEQPVSNAPAALLQRIEDMKFDPILSLGVGYDVSEDFTVSGDFRNRFGDGSMATAPKLHIGAGAEFRGLKVLHLRGGAAIVTDGMELTGGASLVLGPLNISAAGGVRRGDLADTTMGQIGISFGGR